MKDLIEWDLKLLCNDKRTFAKILRECYDQNIDSFEWENVDGRISLSISGFGAENLKKMTDKLEVEKKNEAREHSFEKS